MKRHSPIEDTHENLVYACSGCGIRMDEFPSHDGWEFTVYGSIPPGPCTGNAYICRVARKLGCKAHRHAAGGFGREVPPWEMTAEELKNAIGRTIHKWRPMPALSDAVVGLLRNVVHDPTVCPILADALEESGCEDAALLDALRTP